MWINPRRSGRPSANLLPRCEFFPIPPGPDAPRRARGVAWSCGSAGACSLGLCSEGPSSLSSVTRLEVPGIRLCFRAVCPCGEPARQGCVTKAGRLVLQLSTQKALGLECCSVALGPCRRGTASNQDTVARREGCAHPHCAVSPLQEGSGGPSVLLPGHPGMSQGLDRQAARAGLLPVP